MISDNTGGVSRAETTEVQHRSYKKWCDFLGSDTAQTKGFVEHGLKEETSAAASRQEGVWKTAPCMANCSCKSSRCLLKAYVVDGIPTKLTTDEQGEDSIENLQRKACARGYAQISNYLSADRVKYPMKRKGWSPENPHGELRGRDEWERISWDEALDIIASEMRKVIDEYGTRGILTIGYPHFEPTTFDHFDCLLNALGGALHPAHATISLGSWPFVELFMTGGLFEAPDYLSIQESDLHFFFGCNWEAVKSGNTAHQLSAAKEAGGKIIIIDPWLNQTAQSMADEWIPIRPGTDTAFVLGMAYHMIVNDLQDQAYLDRYCVGFDAEHMPEGAPVEDNFKDYVLGTYDKEPKTPEWAAKICGVPAADTKRLAEEIAATENINFFAGQSVTKIPAGEMFAQVFYTLAFMHGNVGKPGNYASWTGLNENQSHSPHSSEAGEGWNGKGLNPINKLFPPTIMLAPNFFAIEDWDSWDDIEYSEAWKSCLEGSYGRECWPGGKKPVDIHMIYTGGYGNWLNSMPNASKGIEMFRKVDFVMGANPFFCPSVQYADIVLPVATWWEKGEISWSQSSDTVFWADHVMDPLFESRREDEIAVGLAERLGVDPDQVKTMSDAEVAYFSLAGSSYTEEYGGEKKPLITLTQDDLDELGITPYDGASWLEQNPRATGRPQEGLITLAEFKERGFYQTKRKKGDALCHRPYEAFYRDPVAAPLQTSTGKFEIYCPTLAGLVNGYGFSEIAPIGKWIPDSYQGQGAQTEDYPLLLWTPHSLARAHTSFAGVETLKKAFPHYCFMSVVDADDRGIQDEDLVLMTSPHGKILRPVKVTPTVVPGAVALENGAWMCIDEDTGIDIGGNANILQAPAASGQGSQSWTGTICQVTKYSGDLTLEPDKRREFVWAGDIK